MNPDTKENMNHFINYYCCSKCKHSWDRIKAKDQADFCPAGCGREVEPFKSEDLEPESQQRYCYYIPASQTPHPTEGYTPAIVFEGEPGYRLMSGRDNDQQPWYWGDLEEARQCAIERNAERGITEDDAAVIVASSMNAKVGA